MTTPATDTSALPEPSPREKLEGRLAKVEQLLLQGMTSTQIQAVVVKDWGVTSRQARRYIVQVEERWIQTGEGRTEIMLGAAYRRATASGKIGAAISAAVKMGARPKRTPEDIDAFRALGEPPDDPLKAAAWFAKALAVAGRRAMLDASLTPVEARNEIAKHGRAMTGLIPDLRRLDAERGSEEEEAEKEADAAPKPERIGDGAPKLSRPLRGKAPRKKR